MRDRIAAGLLLLAASACGWLAYWFGLWSLAALSVPLAFGVVYASVAFGIWRARPWARWLGIGLAISGAGSFWLVLPRIGFHLDPAITWSAALAHVAVVGLLARPDETPWRIRTSWVLAGIPLLPLIFTGLEAFFVTRLGGNAPGLALVAIPLALVGTIALARSRTWGLLSVSTAGVLLCFAHPVPAYRYQVVMLMTNDMIQLVALVLCAVILPFAGPIARFFSSEVPPTEHRP